MTKIKPQLRIQAYSFTLQELISRINNNEYTFQDSYQRNLVWTEQNKIDFLDHLFVGGEFGVISIQKLKNPYGVWEIVDGQQRTNCIKEFLENKICTSKNIYFKDLSKDEYRIFSMILMVTNDLTTLSQAEIIQYYININSKGIRHTEEDINKAKELLLTL